MNRRRITLLALALFATATASGCGYNTLQTKQQNVKGKWAGIESALQRRADLIPNLFEAAKAAGIQEQQVFGDISAARAGLLKATSEQPQGENGDKSPEQKQKIIEANNSFGGTIGRLLSLVENYPDLKSAQSFQMFQNSLEGTENRIKVSRDDYNAAVQDYNTSRGNFPMVIAAKLYGFKEEPYFKAEEGSRQAPTINADSLRRNQGGAQTNTNR
jgi:LemA protein